MARSENWIPSSVDCQRADDVPDTPQSRAPAYRLAFRDQEFLLREDLRPIRLQLELLKPELVQQERGINSTVVIFGSARIPASDALLDPAASAIAGSLNDKAGWYDEARRFARRASEQANRSYGKEFVVVSGGGPGIMEAANRGAADVGAPSIGLNIVLPFEQAPNRFVTPELCFNFHYFAIRKMHFLIRAKAMAAFPGGFGTLDELFEALTLVQTHKIAPLPILLFGEQFWRRVINFEALVEEGTIAAKDLSLFHFVETAEQGWAVIAAHYGLSEEGGLA